MKNPKFFVITISLIGLMIVSSFFLGSEEKKSTLLSYQVDLTKQSLTFHWKDSSGKIIANFNNLKKIASKQNKQLIFAMNGGMYNKDSSPKGLYIEQEVLLSPIDTITKGFGNFYLQPNGIFYITQNNKGKICRTPDFKNSSIKYATQSGPLLLIEGSIHPRFNKGSNNLNIRNGVGILPDGKILFAMSKRKINFYDFAQYFKSKGCRNALYLDGYVSRTYLPEKNWVTTDGNFGVMIAVMQ